MHYLNNTSAVIFELCEGHRSIEEIAEQVQDVFSLPAPPIDEVKACVSDLVDKAVVR